MTNIQERLEQAVASFEKNAQVYEQLGKQLLVQQGAIQALEQLLAEATAEESSKADADESDSSAPAQ